MMILMTKNLMMHHLMHHLLMMHLLLMIHLLLRMKSWIMRLLDYIHMGRDTRFWRICQPLSITVNDMQTPLESWCRQMKGWILRCHVIEGCRGFFTSAFQCLLFN